MHIDRPNIDRAMVNLFFEIKRNMPSSEREEMKISSPLIGQKLISVYQKSNNDALKFLIERFMDRAGEDWTGRLEPAKKSNFLFSRNPVAPA